ncbi:amino acid ABC transporter permease [Salinicoccus albus]|uniref:amino acid ABC transporter permease n=1 Tax=Salinicoccus albus TaxID=418756 RepID=UPI0003633802|nr:amino acid ABC transporter permease [Salinicoccus albus]
MNFEYMLEILPRFFSVIPVTALIIAVSFIAGLLLSVGVTIIRVKKIPVFNRLMDIYLSFTRSAPILLQLFIFYFGIPVLLQAFGIAVTNVEPIVAAIACLVFYNGAFMSEILRPAYLAIDKGQFEAADSLGYTGWQKFSRITMPQLIPIALPGMTNAMIHLIHDSSLIFAIGVVDIMGLANIIGSETYGLYQVEVFLTVAVIYWVISLIFEQLVKLFDKRRRKVLKFEGYTSSEGAG